MLTMDLANLEKGELADTVSRRCAQYGKVGTVVILRPPEQPQTAFALVSMESPAALARLIRGLGAVKTDTFAIIQIRERTHSIPVSLLRKDHPHQQSSAPH